MVIYSPPIRYLLCFFFFIRIFPVFVFVVIILVIRGTLAGFSERANLDVRLFQTETFPFRFTLKRSMSDSSYIKPVFILNHLEQHLQIVRVDRCHDDVLVEPIEEPCIQADLRIKVSQRQQCAPESQLKCPVCFPFQLFSFICASLSFPLNRPDLFLSSFLFPVHSARLHLSLSSAL